METRPIIDEVDIKILSALIRDARTNLADIAKDCNISRPAITKRYQKMKKNGIITGTLLITEQASRDTHSLSVDLKVESEYTNSIIEDVKQIPGCRICIKVLGKYDIHAGIRVKSLEQIGNVKKKLEKIQGVLQIDITTSIDRLYFFPENILLLQTEAAKNG